MGAQNLREFLHSAATRPGRGITFHSLRGSDERASFHLSYRDLLNQAKRNAARLYQTYSLHPQSVVIVHFPDHRDNVVWFWTAIIAGLIPLMSTPFAHHPEQRARHILHLNSLADHPLWITSASALPDFGSEIEDIKICVAERLAGNDHADWRGSRGHFSRDLSPSAASDIAALMLTSGSTGLAKAVRLTHDQISAAIEGKSNSLSLGSDEVYLTWVGLDHVAGLVEGHIAAVRHGMNQIMTPAQDILPDPRRFLSLLSKYKVTFSFAPNFLLSKLVSLYMDGNIPQLDRFDLSSLKVITSGGEANSVETCRAANALMQSFGANHPVVVPGFGMTETCAGAIFNRQLVLDIESDRDYASLGYCGPGIQMRITGVTQTQDFTQINIHPGDIGSLEVQGEVVFQGYHNNPDATKEAFTVDGWFKTGDQAFVDIHGRLHLVGRTKEVININGLKYSPHQVESALEDDKIPEVTPGFVIVFSYRPPRAATEQVVVLYLPTYHTLDTEARVRARTAISNIVLQCIMATPYILPLDSATLLRTSIGKLTRSKFRKAFVGGELSSFQRLDEQLCQDYHRQSKHAIVNSTVAISNDIEKIVVEECRELLNGGGGDLADSELVSFDVETDMFQTGLSSVDLLRLKSRLQQRLSLPDIPLITLMTHRTARSLATTLQDIQRPLVYNPVVVLREQGSKTPLWLVHPGVGEVLVFLGLAKHLTDRPVYAFRARGFDKGERHFSDIADAVSTYCDAIRQKQPEGPIAIAGYSYGAMLAFEIAKSLRADGREVRFVGSFNLPPHIKNRMKVLDWYEALLNLSCFLDFLTFPQARELSPSLRKLSDRTEAVQYIMSVSDQTRIQDLDMSVPRILNWTNLALGLQSIAREYEPMGFVEGIDVFCAIPLAAVADSPEDWHRNHLSKWADFSITPPRFHQVHGEHYTMMNRENVASFHTVLQAALEARGV